MAPARTGRAASCKPRPRERLWTLWKNGKRVDAELLFHDKQAVETQFLHEGVMAYGRRAAQTAVIRQGGSAIICFVG